MGKTGKRIPITVAKKIAVELGYSQVIIHAWDSETGVNSVCTYGKTLADCDNAAKGGNFLKKHLGFPEEMCDTVPSRKKK